MSAVVYAAPWSSALSAILEQIRDWASTLKYWEQATLEKVANGSKLTEEDYSDLVTLWHQDAGLLPIPPQRRQPLFPQESGGTTHRPKTKLIRLHSLSNVNALPQRQELPFCSQITLIYGLNGAGKTGYARPLGCAAFTRGNKEVLPNEERQSSRPIPTAEIDVLFEGKERPTQISWKAGQQCPELGGFYVFDTQSLGAHLLDENAMSVTPSALGLLTRLVDETDAVRRRVRSLIDQHTAPHALSGYFQGVSAVSDLIASLGPDTNLEKVNQLASLSAEEKSHLEELETKVAQLKLQTDAQRLKEKRRELIDLENLHTRLQNAASATAPASESAAEQLLRNLWERQAAAASFGAEQFADESFTQVGTDVWRSFVSAAKQLAEAEERESGVAYPQDSSRCLLCQQSLSTEALHRFTRLWDFVSSDAQKRLAEARVACENRARELTSVPLEYFSQDCSVRRLLEAKLPTIIPAIEAYAESSAARIAELASALKDGRSKLLPPPVSFDPTQLLHLIEIVRSEIQDVGHSEEGQSLVASETSLRELHHRRTLADRLPAIEKYVHSRRWAHQAEQEIGTTGHITRAYNDIFESLVTDKYKATFETLLQRFGRNLRVSVETRGHKGQTVRQIVLRRDDFPSEPPIASVLSDGEKRVVAISDFLAEAATDDSCDGLILDDPVTSFDADWKKELATYLIERADAGQQVIVFTHDLAFLYDIHEGARECALEVRDHWVERRNNSPGFLFADNSPASERDFKSAKYADECWRKCRNLPPVEQQDILHHGFGALRSSYEALVVFGLFNEVVRRFDQRMRFDRLGQVNFDNDLAREVSERWGQLSRYIDAHLHIDEAQKPTPEMLRTEIDKFNELNKKIAHLRSDVSTTHKPQAKRPNSSSSDGQTL